MLARGFDLVVRPVLAPVVEPVLRPVRDRVLRVCPVPDDLASVTTIGLEEGSAADRADVEAVWSRVEGLYRSGMHPAIQLCIRHRDEVVLDRAIGHAAGVYPGRPLDPDVAVPVTTDTPISLFSASKAVSAMLVHLLHERGVLDIDAPVADYLPAFAAKGKHAITLRHVLTHRAGVPDLPAGLIDLDVLRDPDLVESLVCDLGPSAPFDGLPSYHALSGGFILECVSRAASGESLRHHLRREVKEPLGLEWFDLGVEDGHADRVATNVCTGVPLPPPVSWASNRVLGLGWDDAVVLSNDDRFRTAVIPSANLVATARDAAAFYQCLLDGPAAEVQVFDPATIERARTPHPGGLALDLQLLLPLLYSEGFMLGTSTISPYGWNHPEAFGHLGLINCLTWADPERELVVALLTTGKAMVGTHLPALVQLVSEIHRRFPVDP